jgi:hypothetical protein
VDDIPEKCDENQIEIVRLKEQLGHHQVYEREQFKRNLEAHERIESKVDKLYQEWQSYKWFARGMRWVVLTLVAVGAWFVHEHDRWIEFWKHWK